MRLKSVTQGCLVIAALICLRGSVPSLSWACENPPCDGTARNVARDSAKPQAELRLPDECRDSSDQHSRDVCIRHYCAEAEHTGKDFCELRNKDGVPLTDGKAPEIGTDRKGSANGDTTVDSDTAAYKYARPVDPDSDDSLDLKRREPASTTKDVR